MSTTFFEKWQNNEQGFTNLGSFATLLMQTYQAASSNNKQILDTAFPEYFKPTNSHITFSENPNECFKTAIAAGLLSEDKSAHNYVGNYIYMGTTNGKASFKHFETRRYLKY